MTKTNYKSNLATLEGRDTLADTELNAVVAGFRVEKTYTQQKSLGGLDGAYPPTIGGGADPIGTWHDLLNQYGY